MHKRKQRCLYHTCFSQNIFAVVDLPLKLIVSLTIGAMVILSLLGFISLMPFPTSSMHVTILPTMDSINATKNTSFIHITVTDSSTHNPIRNCLVTIKGSDIIAYNQTNQTGECTISLHMQIPQGIQEQYLDLTVKAARYDLYEQNNAIRIVFN